MSADQYVYSEAFLAGSLDNVNIVRVEGFKKLIKCLPSSAGDLLCNIIASLKNTMKSNKTHNYRRHSNMEGSNAVRGHKCRLSMP